MVYAMGNRRQEGEKKNHPHKGKEGEGRGGRKEKKKRTWLMEMGGGLRAQSKLGDKKMKRRKKREKKGEGSYKCQINKRVIDFWNIRLRGGRRRGAR